MSVGETAKNLRLGISELDEAYTPLVTGCASAVAVTAGVQDRLAALHLFCLFFEAVPGMIKKDVIPQYVAAEQHYNKAGELIIPSLEGAEGKYAETARHGAAELSGRAASILEIMKVVDAEDGALKNVVFHLREALHGMVQVRSELTGAIQDSYAMQQDFHAQTAVATQLYAEGL